MPNWCSNKLIVSGSAASIKQFLDWLGEGKGLLSKINPTPEELTERQSPFNGTKEESAALVAKYGFDNWYDWNIANWGTKWDVNAQFEDYSINDEEVIIYFDSAWSPPQLVIAELAKKFENLSINHAYLEEAMCFVGYDNYEAGVLVDDFHSDDPDSERWKLVASDYFGWEPWEDDEDEEEASAETK